MLDDYFEANPGFKDLKWPEIEPQSCSPQPVTIVMSYSNPNVNQNSIVKLNKR